MVHIRTSEEIEKIRESGRIVYETIMLVGREIRPGITTRRLDRLADEFIRSQGGRSAFKGYRGFPGSICTSINEQVVHGIPSDRVLESGEIISIDVGVRKNGYIGDAARTFAVGTVADDRLRLMRVTEESLNKGIAQARPGNHLSDIGHAIQVYVERFGYGVVRELVGHGVGRELHEPPEIPNYGEPGRGPVLKVGMCLAIEPMITMGTYEVRLLRDGWTVVTEDRLPSAHYEHTIAIGPDGPQILTQVA
ncbi:MAG: type I methionyl aminopeptidase [Candidatus Marinimicrobia bacterium]|jgi:methionyl aminopeptidase|nr:type I methionyl aminopeptidase [Candidatus Neomarinimicrobiota bacterium]MCK9482898.1 type I methionyl aminopeptidase [Candidatus Neomarinimicrobiota bacterium]MCK9559450.1 type I methionyl aminopeptidase [Candidatus Neomarinimicrobiota bacterium]MDD5539636.1 type I methionyl aminopeptidase [Candidatus Neomarinimicrobiota bacterium]